MNILELFCGTKSFTKVAEARGHECRTLDNDSRFGPTYCMDIMDFDPIILDGWHPDVVWASPPCTCFSVASIGTHWGGGRCAYIPQTSDAESAKLIVAKTVELICTFQPDFFFIENPRGVLRKLDIIPFPRKTTWYCQYGDTRAKPTDIWTNLQNWNPKTCHNGSKDHEEARRGAKTGTQGRHGAIERSIVPEKLCLELIIAWQTIRQFNPANPRKVGDKLLLHGWSGTPYRSPWNWRREETVTQEVDMLVHQDWAGFWQNPITGNPISIQTCQIEYLEWNEDLMDEIARLDGIDPPTGNQLQKVLESYHGKFTDKPVQMQVIRW